MFKPLIQTHIFPKRNADFSVWYNEYKKDLINLFKIMIEILDERYENVEDYDNNELFTEFVHFIYKKSSKYVFKE